MLRFSAQSYVRLGSLLAQMQEIVSDPDDPERPTISEKEMISFRRFIKKICARTSNELKEVSCDLSSLAAKRLAGEMASLSHEIIRARLSELHECICDELQSHMFFWVPPDRAKFYGDTRKTFGVDVRKRFPSSIREIEKAGKCIAVALPTAAVFHLMRVMEIGLRAIGASLGIALNSHDSWERILTKISAEEIKKDVAANAKMLANLPFYQSARQTVSAVKDACRNRAMHFDGDWDEDEAKEIMTATRSFMKRVAAKLDEKGNLHA
jgi:hypothetical protein